MNAGAITMVGAPSGGPSPSAPVASFTYVPHNPFVGQLVYFTDTSTNTPTSWSWTVNGGQFSTAKNPTLVPTSQGTYVVVLTATNAFGSSQSSPGIVTAHN